MAEKWYWYGRGTKTVKSEKKVWETEKGADCSTNSTFRDTRFYWQTKIFFFFGSDYKANNAFLWCFDIPK